MKIKWWSRRELNPGVYCYLHPALHVYFILVFDIIGNEQTKCHRLAHWPFESVL